MLERTFWNDIFKFFLFLWCYLLTGFHCCTLDGVNSRSTGEREIGLKRRGVSSIAPNSQSTHQSSQPSFSSSPSKSHTETSKQASWRRILLLIIAITIHNIPGSNSMFMYLCLYSCVMWSCGMGGNEIPYFWQMLISKKVWSSHRFYDYLFGKNEGYLELRVCGKLKNCNSLIWDRCRRLDVLFL